MGKNIFQSLIQITVSRGTIKCGKKREAWKKNCGIQVYWKSGEKVEEMRVFKSFIDESSSGIAWWPLRLVQGHPQELKSEGANLNKYLNHFICKSICLYGKAVKSGGNENL